MVRRSFRAVSLVVLAAAVALAGCDGGSSGTTAAPQTSQTPVDEAPVAGADCAAAMPGVRPVRFGAETDGKPRSTDRAGDGTDLGGILLGSGPTGVLLAHQRGLDVCMWASYALDLSKTGHRVLAVDLPGYGSSVDSATALDDAVVAGAGLLRKEGAERVVLIGASMGGTAVIGAAAKIAPPVAGVISLSGPSTFDGVDAAAAAPKLTVPALYAVCRNDRAYVSDAQALYAATPASTKSQLLVDECSHHGLGALTYSEKIHAAVDAFLKARFA